MKTKKNTRSNPKLDNRIADILVVLFAFSIAGTSLFFFLKNLNKTISRDNPSIAIVSYKYNRVQRKFIDRAVWDRPSQYANVYNGDTIRTAADSEAVIYFTDKSVINVGENTMIQIFKPKTEEAVSLEINSGNVSVKTADTKMVLKSGQTAVSIEKESILHGSKSEEASIKLAVEKGEASVSKSEDVKTENASGETKEAVLSSGEIFADQAEASITMISPSLLNKIFNFNKEGEPIEVGFKWHSSFPESEEIIFEMSQGQNFNTLTEKIPIQGINELRKKISAGTVYWRLYASSKGPKDSSAVTGKLIVIEAPPPLLIEPALDEKFSYNDDTPIRFSWKGNSAAASYRIEIADNAELKNPKINRTVNTSSINISGLEEGKWYWRVIPDYFIDKPDFLQSSNIGSFDMEKRKSRDIIELKVSQSIIKMGEDKKASFSWSSIPEAKKYSLRVSSDENMDNVVLQKILISNYFEIKDLEKELASSDYYWDISALDKNDETLALSKPQKIKIGGDDLFIRSVFPPDDYIITDTYCIDTHFTWKTNSAGEQYFQVSSSPDFKNINLNTKALNSGIGGIALDRGEWFWRVLINTGKEELKTEIKKLNIVPPLPKPEFVGLQDKIIILPSEKNKFRWKKVPEADFYQVRITPKGLNQKPIYENLYVTDTEIELDMKSILDGTYIISVQGFAALTEKSGRRYGYTADHETALMHLKPIELIYPKNDSNIKGIDAVLQTTVLKWDSVEDPKESELILIKTGQKQPILSIKNPDKEIQLPPLGAGKYRWSIKAKTSKGFDISSKNGSSFTVLPIPKLPAPDIISPAKNQNLDVSFFKNNRSIKFIWKRVPDAAYYIVRIYNSSKTVYRDTITQTNSGNIIFDFDKLNLLSRDMFYIEVKAQRKFKDGIIQDGNKSTLKFKIDLPQAQKLETDETGIMYGK